VSQCEVSVLDEIAPILLTGQWIEVGYDSAIKLEGEIILHRYNGQIVQQKLSWLLDEVPLLNWILKNS